jgi:arginine deiminase
MTKKILVGLGALALVIAASAAWAHGPGRHLMMKQMMDKRVAEAEDLIQATPDQRAQIENSKNAIVAALQQNAQARRQQHQDFVALLTTPGLTATQLHDRVAAHLAQMQTLADSTIIPEIVKVNNMLSQDQLSKLAAKAEELHQKHMQRKGGFGGPAE